MNPKSKVSTSPKSLTEKLAFIDHLIQSNFPKRIEEQGTALGIKLALLMAKELQEGQPLGTYSGEEIAGWIKVYGEAQTESAVQMARKLLLEPKFLESELQDRFIH